MRLSRSVAIALLVLAPACGGDDDGQTADSVTPITNSTVPDTPGTSQTGTSPKGTTTTGFAVADELSPDEMIPVATAVCEAAGQVSDRAAAALIFNGRAHDGIHSIARQLQQVDLGPAAALLRAKQKVEADLGAAATRAEWLRADLLALAAATTAGIRRLAPDTAVPACT